ncbi:MAG: glycyl-radical enzyme activating protein [Suipraeoptans sp.]
MKTVQDKGMILQMQNLSVNDGEGIRTTIFMAGCPLRCKWCSNPESFTIKRKVAVYQSECIKCERCKDICPSNLYISENRADEKQCMLCGACVESCPTHAIEIMNEQISIDDIVKRIEREELFFRYSNGGVTFSGGEATFQEGFLRSIVDRLYERNTSMWLETCGYFDFNSCRDILEKLDHVFFDIKTMDSTKHKEYTGVDNKSILENAKHIYELNIPMTIRVPLVKHINDNDENIYMLSSFIRENIPNADIEILPYHNLGLMKYKALGYEELINEYETPDAKRISEIYKIFSTHDVKSVEYR